MSGTASLNCSEARHVIHLSCGGDALETEEQLLAGHLDGCSDCRSYASGMQSAMTALETARDHHPGNSDHSFGSSVWDSLRSDLSRRRSADSRLTVIRRNADESRERRPFNVAVAALCACSLVLAFVSILSGLPGNSVETAGNLWPSNQPDRAMSTAVSNPGPSMTMPYQTTPFLTPSPGSANGPVSLLPVYNRDGSLAGYIRNDNPVRIAPLILPESGEGGSAEF